MQIIIIAGAPAVGKTSVAIKVLQHLINENSPSPSIVKMDCLRSNDEASYKKLNLPIITGLSGHLCPDHYLATNLNQIFDWANNNQSNMLIIETAGLCNRCAPFIKGALNICVIDSTSSIKSPEKLGPMVTTASVLVLTKCDMISQAEKEILIFQLKELNSSAEIYIVNGITGSGTKKLSKLVLSIDEILDITEQTLVYEMPRAICSYCVGETRIGKEYHQGIIEYMDIGGCKCSN